MTTDKGKPVNVKSLGRVLLHGSGVAWALLLRAVQMIAYERKTLSGALQLPREKAKSHEKKAETGPLGTAPRNIRVCLCYSYNPCLSHLQNFHLLRASKGKVRNFSKQKWPSAAC